jgi:hypothetical protein
LIKQVNANEYFVNKLLNVLDPGLFTNTILPVFKEESIYVDENYNLLSHPLGASKIIAFKNVAEECFCEQINGRAHTVFTEDGLKTCRLNSQNSIGHEKMIAYMGLVHNFYDLNVHNHGYLHIEPTDKSVAFFLDYEHFFRCWNNSLDELGPFERNRNLIKLWPLINDCPFWNEIKGTTFG